MVILEGVKKLLMLGKNSMACGFIACSGYSHTLPDKICALGMENFLSEERGGAHLIRF